MSGKVELFGATDSDLLPNHNVNTRYDLFDDYLRPYFKQNPTVTLKKSDIFKFRGVQFKVPSLKRNKGKREHL